MKGTSTPGASPAPGPGGTALEEMTASFERFCLAAGLEALGALMEADATALCGPRHGRGSGRQAQRWGQTEGPIGFHGGKVAVPRPRLRQGGQEVTLPSWERAVAEDWLGRWAMNLMLIGVSTRRFGRAVRLPEGDVPAGPGAGGSKSAASRRFVALSAERMAAWMAQDLSGLDLLAVQIDGLHITEDLVLLAAVGIDAEGAKHPLGLVEGATENAVVVQALLDDLVGRGLDPAICRLFIVDGAKALSKAIRRTFGRDTPINAARFTRPATSLSGCRKPCRRRSGGRCGRPGNWTTRPRPSGCCAISPAPPRPAPPAPPRPSWRGSTRSSPWSGWGCRASCAARSPAPTSSRTSWARCAAS